MEESVGTARVDRLEACLRACLELRELIAKIREKQRELRRLMAGVEGTAVRPDE